MIRVITEDVRRVVVHQVADSAIPGTGQVTIRIELVGVCGSDAHVYEGTHPYLNYPQVQGHEIVGIIDAVGPGTHVPVGARVVVEPTVACGECIACRRGRPNCCRRLHVMGITRPGGLSETLVVDEIHTHEVGRLHPDAAVLIEPLAVALHAVDRARVTAADTVLVIGAGSIGRVAVVAARSRGARVLVAERTIERRVILETLGAESVIGTGTAELTDAVAEFTGGDGCTVIIEATGNAELLRLALDLVAYSGTVVAVGISEDNLSVPVSLLSRKEVALLGSRNSDHDFPGAIELARAHQAALRATISDRVMLSDAEAAFLSVLNRSAVGKVVVVMPIAK